MKVAYYGGEHEVNIGDRFTFATGDSWQVERLVGGGMYSPSGIGGTAVYACRCLDDRVPGYCEKYVEADGTVNMCGDSVAGALAEQVRRGGE